MMAQLKKSLNTSKISWLQGTTTALIVSLSLAACSSGRFDNPMDAAEKYHQSTELHDGEVIATRIVDTSDSSAVIAVTIAGDNDNSDRSSDWYTFVSKDPKKGWLVTDTKTIAVPDSLLADESKLSPALSLLASPDSAAKEYLIEHKPLFDSIIDVFMERAVLSAVDIADTGLVEVRDGKILQTNRSAKVQDMLSQTLASRVFRDARHQNCTFVKVASVEHGEMGYMFAEEGCLLPEMSPDFMIYFEPISDNWYIYKAAY